MKKLLDHISLKESLSTVRPDPSLNSGLKAALSSHSVRPELVEGYRYGF